MLTCLVTIIYTFLLPMFPLTFVLCISVSLLLGVDWFMMSIFFVNCTFYH